MYGLYRQVFAYACGYSLQMAIQTLGYVYAQGSCFRKEVSGRLDRSEYTPSAASCQPALSLGFARGCSQQNNAMQTALSFIFPVDPDPCCQVTCDVASVDLLAVVSSKGVQQSG